MKKPPELKVHCAHQKLVPAGALKLDPQNPNHHPEAQLRIYVRILKATGWRRAVVVSIRSGTVIKGNGAVMAARLIGCPVPVDYQEYPDRKSEIADMLADKKLADRSEFDEDAARELLSDFAPEDWELAGFTHEEEPEPDADVQPLSIMPAPKMAWALIGIPIEQFAPVQALLDKMPKTATISVTANDQVAATDEPDFQPQMDANARK